MVYKEKDAQLEDNRSTAYTFLGVGIAGLIFVILFALDIIKLPMADYCCNVCSVCYFSWNRNYTFP